MSVVVVGLSHRTAPLALLERAAVSQAAAVELGARLRLSEHIAEAAVLATCNRLEIYAEVSKFHGGVAEIGTELAAITGVGLDQLTDHLYVHYEDDCVRHLFAVACGLDSMAVGEAQILGQVRGTLRAARQRGSVGRCVGRLLENGLRVGKRAHAETRLDRAAPDLVEVALDRAVQILGPLAERRLLVIGAGSMSGLVVATAARAGIRSISVISRTPATAARLAASVGGIGMLIADLPSAVAEADLVIACAGAPGHLVGPGTAAAAASTRAASHRAAEGGSARPQLYLDLALPRDVDPAVGELPGVILVDLEQLGRDLAARGLAEDLAEVRAMVHVEVTGYLAALRAEAVAPAVVALRAMANSVVEAELARLESRLEGVDQRVRDELAQTVHRVVDKLLHTPTVRVKQLAAAPGGDSYAEALRALFGLGGTPPDGQMPAGTELEAALRPTGVGDGTPGFQADAWLAELAAELGSELADGPGVVS